MFIALYLYYDSTVKCSSVTRWRDCLIKAFLAPFFTGTFRGGNFALPLCLNINPWRRIRGLEEKLNECLTLVIYGGYCSGSRLGHSPPGEEKWFPPDGNVGGFQKVPSPAVNLPTSSRPLLSQSLSELSCLALTVRCFKMSQQGSDIKTRKNALLIRWTSSLTLPAIYIGCL
jgi:hypothetical protein